MNFPGVIVSPPTDEWTHKPGELECLAVECSLAGRIIDFQLELARVVQMGIMLKSREINSDRIKTWKMDADIGPVSAATRRAIQILENVHDRCELLSVFLFRGHSSN